MSEAVPALLAAPAIMKAAPLVVGAGVKAAQSVMKATKQGQGGRSQPTDYGQGGTATPRGKSVQRPSGKMTAADAQKRQAALDRKAEAKLRAKDKQSELENKIDKEIKDTVGTAADRAAAAKRREKNISQKPTTPDQRLDSLVGKAAKNLGIKLP